MKIEWQGEVDLSKNPDLEYALKEFTDKKGREIRKWTNENIEKQIEIIEQKYGSEVSGNFVFGLTSIYRHASEIMHGTFFGALFSIGMTSPSEKPKTADEMKMFWGGNISMLLLTLIASLNSVLIVLSTDYSMADLVEKSEKLIGEIKDQEWVKASKK